MKNEKYQGIIPAFYACYDKDGNIDKEGVRKFTRHLINKGVNGLYIGGSSGECIYQTVAERKIVLEEVMKENNGEVVIIAHVACNSTRESMELAKHAESLGVDAIAAIPPIYFKVGDEGVAKYWNDISSAAPNTDFIIYNIPQLTGISLNRNILKMMLKNKKVVGVKNSSLAALDIFDFIDCSGDELFVFNGPDEQLVSGLSMGAIGGIGGTYGLMPELYLLLYKLEKENKMKEAGQLQFDLNKMIYMAVSGKGSMYAIIKGVLKKKFDLDLGGVRSPLLNMAEGDDKLCDEIIAALDKLYEKYEIK